MSIAGSDEFAIRPCTGAWLVLDYACNCSCVFCPISGLEPSFKSIYEIRASIDRAASACTRKHMEFSGGEILLHPELTEAVRYAKEKGFSHIHFFTNGILFADLETCARYVNLGLESVMLSIHGATEETHETLMRARGGSYQAVWQAVHNLGSLGVHVIVNFVVTKRNVAEIPLLFDLCLLAHPAIKQLRITYPAIEGEMAARKDLLVHFEEALDVLTPLVSRPKLIELRVELFPFCVLGTLTNLSVEWLGGHETSYFEEFCSIRYHRALGRECIECSHRTSCHGIQEDYVRMFGVPKGFCGDKYYDYRVGSPNRCV